MRGVLGGEGSGDYNTARGHAAAGDGTGFTVVDSGRLAQEHAHADDAAALDDDAAATPRLDDYDFIEELTQEDSEPEPAGKPVTLPETETTIRLEDIEALSDRVLDQIAPALREAVAAAVTELLAGRLRDPD